MTTIRQNRVITVCFASRRVTAPVSVALTTTLRLTNQHEARVTCIVDNAVEPSFGRDHPETAVYHCSQVVTFLLYTHFHSTKIK